MPVPFFNAHWGSWQVSACQCCFFNAHWGSWQVSACQCFFQNAHWGSWQVSACQCFFRSPLGELASKCLPLCRPGPAELSGWAAIATSPPGQRQLWSKHDIMLQ